MADNMKFGPEWLRNSVESQEADSDNLGDSAKYSLPTYRYGREEMLAMFTLSAQAPEPLRNIKNLYVDKAQVPLAFKEKTAEEERLWNSKNFTDPPLKPASQVPASFVSIPYSGMREGVSVPRGRGQPSDRGRGRGLPRSGTYHYTGRPYEDFGENPNGYMNRNRYFDKSHSHPSDRAWIEREDGDHRQAENIASTSPRQNMLPSKNMLNVNWRRAVKEDDDKWRLVKGPYVVEKIGGWNNWRDGGEKDYQFDVDNENEEKDFRDHHRSNKDNPQQHVDSNQPKDIAEKDFKGEKEYFRNEHPQNVGNKRGDYRHDGYRKPRYEGNRYDGRHDGNRYDGNRHDGIRETRYDNNRRTRQNSNSETYHHDGNNREARHDANYEYRHEGMENEYSSEKPEKEARYEGRKKNAFRGKGEKDYQRRARMGNDEKSVCVESGKGMNSADAVKNGNENELGGDPLEVAGLSSHSENELGESVGNWLPPCESSDANNPIIVSDAEIPEWALDDPKEANGSNGSFDSSGAFHGSDSGSEDEKNKKNQNKQEADLPESSTHPHTVLEELKSEDLQRVIRENEQHELDSIEDDSVEEKFLLDKQSISIVNSNFSPSELTGKFSDLHIEFSTPVSPDSSTTKDTKMEVKPSEPPPTTPYLHDIFDENQKIIQETADKWYFEGSQVRVQAVSHEAKHVEPTTSVPMPENVVQDLLSSDKEDIAENMNKWIYKDLHGLVQGPFTNSDMREWYALGYFRDPMMLVKKLYETEFYPMQDLLRRYGDNPFPVPVDDGKGPPSAPLVRSTPLFTSSMQLPTAKNEPANQIQQAMAMPMNFYPPPPMKSDFQPAIKSDFPPAIKSDNQTGDKGDDNMRKLCDLAIKVLCKNDEWNRLPPHSQQCAMLQYIANQQAAEKNALQGTQPNSQQNAQQNAQQNIHQNIHQNAHQNTHQNAHQNNQNSYHSGFFQPNPLQIPNQPRMPGFDQMRLPGLERPRLPNLNQHRLPGLDQHRMPGLDHQPRLPGFEQPRLPGFDQPRLPGFDQPRLPGFEQPRLPGFEQPRLPGFDQSRLPSFDHSRITCLDQQQPNAMRMPSVFHSGSQQPIHQITEQRNGANHPIQITQQRNSSHQPIHQVTQQRNFFTRTTLTQPELRAISQIGPFVGPLGNNPIVHPGHGIQSRPPFPHQTHATQPRSTEQRENGSAVIQNLLNQLGKLQDPGTWGSMGSTTSATTSTSSADKQPDAYTFDVHQWVHKVGRIGPDVPPRSQNTVVKNQNPSEVRNNTAAQGIKAEVAAKKPGPELIRAVEAMKIQKDDFPKAAQIMPRRVTNQPVAIKPIGKTSPKKQAVADAFVKEGPKKQTNYTETKRNPSKTPVPEKVEKKKNTPETNAKKRAALLEAANNDDQNKKFLDDKKGELDLASKNRKKLDEKFLKEEKGQKGDEKKKKEAEKRKKDADKQRKKEEAEKMKMKIVENEEAFSFENDSKKGGKQNSAKKGPKGVGNSQNVSQYLSTSKSKSGPIIEAENQIPENAPTTSKRSRRKKNVQQQSTWDAPQGPQVRSLEDIQNEEKEQLKMQLEKERLIEQQKAIEEEKEREALASAAASNPWEYHQMKWLNSKYPLENLSNDEDFKSPKKRSKGSQASSADNTPEATSSKTARPTPIPVPEAQDIELARRNERKVKEFMDWCTATITELNKSNKINKDLDVSTFIAVLKDVESRGEIEELIADNLGQSKEVQIFTKQFMNKRLPFFPQQAAVSKKDSKKGNKAQTAQQQKGQPNLAAKVKKPAQQIAQKVKKKAKLPKGIVNFGKKKMLSPELLGFQSTSSEDRRNVGEIDVPNVS